MFRIMQNRLVPYMEREMPDVIEKAEEREPLLIRHAG